MGIIETIKMLAMEEGIEKGMEQGMEQGFQIGIEKGEQKKTYEIVKNLLLNTEFDVAKIAALADTSQSIVRELQKDIK
jgi:flagellar biosynthesis/type III secretory pathway protein FliH